MLLDIFHIITPLWWADVESPPVDFYWSAFRTKVIREKSRGEGSLIGQDTIENVSEPKFFFNFLRKKNVFFNFILCQKCFHRLKCFKKMFFAHENMKKPASKVAEPAQIQPKSQFLIHKNLPPRDFSLMTLVISMAKFWLN